MKNHNPKNVILNLASEEPLLRYKGDVPFNRWQNEARKKLFELLGLDLIKKAPYDLSVISEKNYGNYTDTYFTFQSESGYYVPCHILKPSNKTGKLPLLICLQGHSTGMHISIGEAIYSGDEEDITSGDRDYARIAVQKGYCAIALEQRDMGECGGTEKGTGCIHRPQNGINAMPALLYGRTAIGERVHDIITLIDIIKISEASLFDCIDDADIMITGNSGGGTTAFYCACIDERIKYTVPSCSICTYKASIVNIEHCGCNYIPSVARYFDMGDLAGLIAPRGLIIASGENDKIFPIEGVIETFEIAKKLYKAADAENKVKHIIGSGGHRYYADLSFDALEAMRKQPD